MIGRIFGNGKNVQSGQLEIQVTERGFEPARIRVPRDEAITLLVTRKTERTCAREFVLDELGIREALPVGKTVSITFTPRSSGPMKFGCAMGKMIGGVLDVV